MAILQISKIQQRSGNLVDLPQLDDAEFGWANDAKRLFIGKTTPNENVEILTSYSQISFSQIDGAVGNLNISNVSIANGQVLAYDGTNWVNKGGTAGGLITLGDVGNVKITGGAVGYVLETDGTGNLSWTPKGTLAANILNVSKADPALVTTVTDNFFENGSQVTITNPQGMTELAGSIYYANVLTSTTFELYTSWDGTTFSGNVDSLLYTDYSYTTVSATAVSTNVITVGDATVFSEGQAVRFIGNLSTSGLENNVTYYVANAVSTSLKVATTTDVANTVLSLQTTSGLTAEVYAIEGQAVATLGSTVSFPVAGGSDTQIQYNDTGALTGNSAFTYDYGNSILTLNGNANVSNLNATGIATASRFISNVGNGTPPLQVSSYTRVSNLSVAYANVSDFGIVTSQTTGTFYPVFVSSSATGNRALGANANISFNAATGNLSTTILNATTIVATTGNVGTINSGLLQNGNSNVTITANANVTVTSKSNATVVITDTGVNLAGTLNATGNANVGNIGTTTAIITTGNITTINSGLLQNGNSNITITSNANIALTSKSNTTMIISDTGANVTGTANVSGNANVGNLGTSGLIVAAGNISGANVVATSYHIRSITTGITAAGSVQGTATALTKEINVVGTVSSGANGVVLPTAVAGIVLIINNTSANTLNVYPASGAAINSGSANAAYSHSSAASIQYYATSSTQWYTVGATFA
jgi:trimeric autotransporter adhesin